MPMLQTTAEVMWVFDTLRFIPRDWFGNQHFDVFTFPCLNDRSSLSFPGVASAHARFIVDPNQDLEDAFVQDFPPSWWAFQDVDVNGQALQRLRCAEVLEEIVHRNSAPPPAHLICLTYLVRSGD